MQRTTRKTCVVALAIVAVLGIGLAIAVPLAGSALWLPRATIDRFNPLLAAEVTYVPTPAPDAWVETYEDATGSGSNYVYELDAREADGTPHMSYLVVFGGTLKADEPYLRVTAKGCNAQLYNPIPADEVPQAAR